MSWIILIKQLIMHNHDCYFTSSSDFIQICQICRTFLVGHLSEHNIQFITLSWLTFFFFLTISCLSSYIISHCLLNARYSMCIQTLYWSCLCVFIGRELLLLLWTILTFFFLFHTPWFMCHLLFHFRPDQTH